MPGLKHVSPSSGKEEIYSRAACQFCPRPWDVEVIVPVQSDTQEPWFGFWYVCREHAAAPSATCLVKPQYVQGGPLPQLRGVRR